MKKKVALVVSTPIIYNAFYKKHIELLRMKYDIYLISNFNEDDCAIKGLPIYHINIERKPSLLKDLETLFKLIKIFKKEKFDIVHTTTPKAGLLAQIAAYISKIDIRLHYFTGQVWASKTGYKRELLKLIDKVVGALPTHILVDSFSQLDFLITENIVTKGKIDVLGQGSISGVNLCKFYPQDKEKLKISFSIPADNFVFLYLGRLNKDKGVLDLLEAFEQVHNQYPNITLLLVGKDEENLIPFIEKNKLFNSSIFYYKFTDTPEKFMATADVFCLPSYREGFGTVIIEAAACGTPSIGSNIYGLSDAILDKETGLLFEVGNINDLATKMISLINDRQFLGYLSSNGKKRVNTYFDENIVSQLLVSYYEDFETFNKM